MRKRDVEKIIFLDIKGGESYIPLGWWRGQDDDNLEVHCMNNDLKPCPFCGAQPEIIIHANIGTYSRSDVDVKCTNCDAASVHATFSTYDIITLRCIPSSNYQEACDKWNQRTADDPDGSGSRSPGEGVS